MIDSKLLLQNPLIGQEIKFALAEAVVTYGKTALVPESYENSTLEYVELLVSLQDKDMFYAGQEVFIKMFASLWLKLKIIKINLDPPLYAKIEGDFMSWVTV